MHTKNQLFGERPAHGIVAAVLLSMAIVAIGWLGTFAYNAREDLTTIRRQAGVITYGLRAGPKTLHGDEDTEQASTFEKRYAALY